MRPTALPPSLLVCLMLAATTYGFVAGFAVREASLRPPEKQQRTVWIVPGKQPRRAIGQFDLDVSAMEHDARKQCWVQDMITRQMVAKFALDKLHAARFAAVVKAGDHATPCLRIDCQRTDYGKAIVGLHIDVQDKGRCATWHCHQENVDDKPQDIKESAQRLLDLFAHDFEPIRPVGSLLTND